MKVKTKEFENSKKVLLSSSDEYFDNCPVCCLMKKCEAEGRNPTEDETRVAFEKANTQN